MRAELEKQQREITVTTSRGEEFHFEGISDAFRRRLAEWEQSRGIAPELSTSALLDENNAAIKGRADHEAKGTVLCMS
jgi:hypothetical protein